WDSTLILYQFVRTNRGIHTPAAGTSTPVTVNQALQAIGQRKQGRRLREDRNQVLQLQETALKDADLSQADLQRAALWGCDLSGANFSGAQLQDADLRWSDLSGADLSNADLSGT